MNLGGEQDPRESRRDKTKRRMGEYRFKEKGQKNRKVKNLLVGGARGGREGKHKAIQKVNSKEENKIALYPKDK